MHSTRQLIRQQLNSGFERLNAMREELFDKHGIVSFLDGTRLKAKVPCSEPVKFDQIRLVNGQVVWGAIEEVD